MAQGYFNQKSDIKGLGIKSVSAGISADDGEKVSKMAVNVMDKLYGIDISSHRSKSVNEKDVDEAVLILTMSRMHKNLLVSNFPEHHEKIFTLSEYVLESDALHIPEDIKDPYMSDEYTYTKVAKEIAFYIDKLIDCLSENEL